jgi:hypothetical protein
MKGRWVARRVGAGAVIFVVACFVLGWVVMTLWNSLIPELFHGPLITFWQAVGLLILSKIFLHSVGGGHWGHRWKHDRWRSFMEKRLESMSPEEREKAWKRWEGCYGPLQDKNAPTA